MKWMNNETNKQNFYLFECETLWTWVWIDNVTGPISEEL